VPRNLETSQRRFSWLEGQPCLVLAVGARDLNAANLPKLADADLGAPPVLSGWGVFPRLTMSVVDGPGDTGFLVASDLDDIESADKWVTDVESRGGALVVFLGDDEVSSDDVSDLQNAAGGFARLID
jgi:hypothetical protein